MASILDYTDAQIASGLRRLNRQFCTPPGFDKRLLAKIRDEDLARFHEWPSGHWSLTDRGRNFLMECCE